MLIVETHAGRIDDLRNGGVPSAKFPERISADLPTNAERVSSLQVRPQRSPELLRQASKTRRLLKVLRSFGGIKSISDSPIHVTSGYDFICSAHDTLKISLPAGMQELQ